MFKNSALRPHAVTVQVSYTAAGRNSSYLRNIINRGIFGKEKEFITGKKKLI